PPPKADTGTFSTACPPSSATSNACPVNSPISAPAIAPTCAAQTTPLMFVAPAADASIFSFSFLTVFVVVNVAVSTHAESPFAFGAAARALYVVAAVRPVMARRVAFAAAGEPLSGVRELYGLGDHSTLTPVSSAELSVQLIVAPVLLMLVT